MLLIVVHFFGITASGSTRWINLFVFNLQPSELMKIALIMGGLLLATVAASAFWIERLGDQIGVLKGNQLILESKLEEQNEDIRSHLTKQKQTQNQLLSLEKEKQEAQRKWQSDHYDRNREEILQKARDRYRRKSLAEKRKEQRKTLYGEQ